MIQKEKTLFWVAGNWFELKRSGSSRRLPFCSYYHAECCDSQADTAENICSLGSLASFRRSFWHHGRSPDVPGEGQAGQPGGKMGGRMHWETWEQLAAAVMVSQAVLLIHLKRVSKTFSIAPTFDLTLVPRRMLTLILFIYDISCSKTGCESACSS